MEKTTVTVPAAELSANPKMWASLFDVMGAEYETLEDGSRVFWIEYGDGDHLCIQGIKTDRPKDEEILRLRYEVEDFVSKCLCEGKIFGSPTGRTFLLWISAGWKVS